VLALDSCELHCPGCVCGALCKTYQRHWPDTLPQLSAPPCALRWIDSGASDGPKTQGCATCLESCHQTSRTGHLRDRTRNEEQLGELHKPNDHSSDQLPRHPSLAVYFYCLTLALNRKRQLRDAHLRWSHPRSSPLFFTIWSTHCRLNSPHPMQSGPGSSQSQSHIGYAPAPHLVAPQQACNQTHHILHVGLQNIVECCQKECTRRLYL
jgi:hypothetical protein